MKRRGRFLILKKTHSKQQYNGLFLVVGYALADGRSIEIRKRKMVSWNQDLARFRSRSYGTESLQMCGFASAIGRAKAN